MTIMFHAEPLSFYVDKIQKGEPFSSLLFGDGEFTVMSRAKTDKPYTHYREVVTKKLEDELLAAARCDDADVFKGTDRHLLFWEEYKGRDVAAVRSICQKARAVLGERRQSWHDGTVWDEAARRGELAPLLRALHGRPTILVANEGLRPICSWLHCGFVPVPALDAWKAADATEARCVAEGESLGGVSIFLFCAGLGSIPLIMRLRRGMPNATFLDVGSTFDLFVGTGSERGWRAELYASRTAYRELCAKNLEGVCPNDCPKRRS